MSDLLGFLTRLATDRGRPAATALLALALLAGCGGGSTSSVKSAAVTTSTGAFTVAAPGLTLPVPPVANQGSLPYPYSGTVTVTLTRTAAFTGPVTLSVAAATLPAGVRASFAEATIPAGSSTAELSFQAGYATNDSFSAYAYPAQGSYAVTILAAGAADPASTASTSLTLHLVPEPADFGLAFVSADGTSLVDSTHFVLVPGAALRLPLMAYWAQGTYEYPYGPVSLALADVPSDWTVTLDAASVTLNDVHQLSILAPPDLAAGIDTFRINATCLGVSHTLVVPVIYSPAPFYLQPESAAQVTVAAGQSLTFPLYLWHDDAYFGTTAPADGTDPVYVGSTLLSAAAAPVQITAAASLAPGSYPVTLQATRIGTATTTSTRTLVVVVTDPAQASAALWFQAVEWGQSVVAPNLRLVAGKPALLRVQLLADRPGAAAPVLTATVRSAAGTLVDTLELQGPATVPTTVAEGDLPAGAASGSSYSAVLPAGDVLPGMTVSLQALGVAAMTVSPSVAAGTVLDLTAVPVIVAGVAPELPADSVLADALTAFWPIQGVAVTHRAPYTTTTVIANPGTDAATDTSAYGWDQLLSEIAALRTVDGKTGNYYGFLNPGLQFPIYGSIVGLSYLGVGAGIGIDQATAAAMLAHGFVNDDSPLDMATAVMVHEEGHAFNLEHAPAGGAGSPQLDYPYLGAGIGSWGFDPAAQAVYDPATCTDIMSYASTHHWISDWDYLNAMAFLEVASGSAGSLTPAASEQWVVSGWLSPDGTPHLAPLVRVTCPRVPPVAGDLTLRLTTAGGTRSISCSAVQVPDLPAGHRHFAFTVPAGGELTGAAIQTPRAGSFERVKTRSLAARAQAVAAAALDGSLVVREAGGVLHLEWDATAHPYVNVFQEGTGRTTLGLHLTGGRVDLPVGGLPAGGRFVIHYSDGLNAVVRGVDRPGQP